MIIRWTDEALVEYQDILDQAAERDRLEATRIVSRVQRVIRNIEVFPAAAFHNEDRGYYERYVPKTRVILIYKIEADEVIIFAIFHTSRSTSAKP